MGAVGEWRVSFSGLVALLFLACGGGGTDLDAGPLSRDAAMCVASCDGVGCGPDGCGGMCSCGGGDVCMGGLCTDPGGTVTSTVETANTGAMGETTVTVNIDDARSFMVLATTETGARLSVLRIEGPGGARLLRWQDWYNGTRGLTNAFFATDPATVINWPIRDVDPGLVPGEYLVRVGSYRNDGVTSRPDIPIEITTHVSHDSDLERGLVRVALIWADGLGRDAELVTATEAAVVHWREVWAAAGMELELRYVESTLDPALPFPAPGVRTLIEQASALSDDGELALVLGDVVADEAGTYGVSGQIPGPLTVSSLSVILVGWLANAGGDGVFSANDIQLYGEVLAHEVGHYLGLLHPVSSAWDEWDALDDTPECANEMACERDLGTNLMFPVSICDGGSCLSTTVITDDQRGVMQRYTGTL